MGINIWWQKGYISRLVRSTVDINEDTLLYSLNMLLPFFLIFAVAIATVIA